MSWDSYYDAVDRVGAGWASLAESIPRIMSDPRAYPREAMLLAVIAGLLVIFVSLSLMTLVDWLQQRRFRRRTGTHLRASVVARRAFAVLAVTTGAAVLIGLSPAVVPEARLCGSCHSVKPAYDSWAEGAHGAVDCFACHAGRGAAGVLQASVLGISNLRPGDQSGKTAAAVHADRCLACHASLRDEIVGSRVRVQHAEMIDAGITCTACHPRAGHESGSRSGSSIERSVMSRCLACHDSEQASADCSTCHSSDPSDPEGLSVVGRTVMQIGCGGCHAAATEQRCVECHGLELPHPSDFGRVHARLSAEDPSLCARCHETASATLACACHASDVNEHGTYDAWYPRHGAQASASGPGGCLCHKDGGFASCAGCHDENPWVR